jgi:hypothetical protein
MVKAIGGLGAFFIYRTKLGGLPPGFSRSRHPRKNTSVRARALVQRVAVKVKT